MSRKKEERVLKTLDILKALEEKFKMEERELHRLRINPEFVAALMADVFISLRIDNPSKDNLLDVFEAFRLEALFEPWEDGLAALKPRESVNTIDWNNVRKSMVDAIAK